MKLSLFLVWALCITASLLPIVGHTASPGDVIFNEIAWMGTKANSADEWIELKNTTNTSIDLTKWSIYKDGGATLVIELKNSIAPHGYFLIERTDDGTIQNITADLVGPFKDGGLGNGGEHLVLKDNTGTIMQSLNASSGWPAGKASPEYASMEFGSQGWETHAGPSQSGTDAKGNPINGTPRSANSVGEVALSSVVVAAQTPAPTPTPTNTPIATSPVTPSPSSVPTSSPVYAETPTAVPLPEATQLQAATPSSSHYAMPQVSQNRASSAQRTSTPQPEKSPAKKSPAAYSPSISPAPREMNSPAPEREENLAAISESTSKPLMLSMGILLIVVLGTLGVLWKYVMK